MTRMEFTTLLEEVSKRQVMVKNYLNSQRNRLAFSYRHLEDAVYSYLNAGGKSLRPAVLMFACGAVGGDEQTAIPAAAAIELYHTFTLVHDDIIDRDEMRRSVPTVHTEFRDRARTELGFDDPMAEHYGLAIAILAGDMQQGWAASLLPDLYQTYGIPAELALRLVTELFNRTQVTLINGETIDIRQSQTPVEELHEHDVLDMLWKKTGILYEFAGRAGAAIGLREADLNHPLVEAVSAFTSKCGIAFQIQDDILGLTAQTDKLGKPVGSDIREGKRTVILLHALQNMASVDREFVLSVVGNSNAEGAKVDQAITLIREAGGIEHARSLAEEYVSAALTHLDPIHDSDYKRLLISWAHYITSREI
ncbi:MAG: polyprenyl synthetase family protein [Chloroflexota bacterium]